MAFPERARLAIESFAGNVGLVAVPATDGSYSFAFERSGVLTFTPASDGERTLLSLFAPDHRPGPQADATLIGLAGPEISTGRFLSVGLSRDGGIVLAVSLDNADIDLPAIEECLQQLLAARQAAI
jgi:hypothetical protein